MIQENETRPRSNTVPQTRHGLLQTARAHFGSVNGALGLQDSVLQRLRARYVVS